AKCRAAWHLKVFGYVNMCRAYHALMKARKSGVIVNVIGAAAQTRDPGYICGVAGNAALAAFSQSLGHASVQDGVRVVAIHPGPVATDRLVTLLRKRAQDRTGDPETWRELTKSMPFGRPAKPEEIGAMIAFLASDRSGYTSGSVVTIDGGISMGGFASLHFGRGYPERARSIVVAGCGYGAAPDTRQQFAEEAEASAKRIEQQSMTKAAEGYALGPTRVQFQNKDPRGWREFADQLAEHSTQGAALTLRGVQKARPSLYDLTDKMRAMRVPTLVMTGDEDWPCLEPGLLMKRNIATAALVVMPNAGHAINLDDPAAFNRHLADFFQ